MDQGQEQSLFKSAKTHGAGRGSREGWGLWGYTHRAGGKSYHMDRKYEHAQLITGFVVQLWHKEVYVKRDRLYCPTENLSFSRSVTTMLCKGELIDGSGRRFSIEIHTQSRAIWGGRKRSWG